MTTTQQIRQNELNRMFGETGDTYTDKLIRLIRLAQQRASDHNEAFAVIELDHEDGRQLSVCHIDYLDDVEFEAFDGEVIEIVDPK